MDTIHRNIIVIGASAGGFDAIKKIAATLPAGLDAAVFIVWHLSPDVRGVLPQVLNKMQSAWIATHAVDGEPIKHGRIYIAPPDRHMVLEHGRVRVTHGPKENRFRPAVDPLFRSAAAAYGARVIGVILSGALDDGTAGLWTVKHRGGLTVVQDPWDAEVPSMPENAIRAVAVDHIKPVDEISKLLGMLVNQPANRTVESGEYENGKTQTEINIAMEERGLDIDIFKFGEISPYTCPDCHGVLTALNEGGRIRFRCHTGHAFSVDSLLATLTENIEESLWTAVRGVQESVMLLNHMGDHFAEVNQPKLAAMYFKKAKEAEERIRLVRKAVVDHEQLSAEGIKQESEEAGGEQPG
ncbi:MAG: CheB methylesterase [Flavipsychrobacter sp.]|nr:CheB methylesterase [Flavipsychrobacter sp.]